MIRVSGQSKSRPVKAAGAEVGAQRRNQKLHAAVAKSTFGSSDVEKMHAAVVKRTFGSENVKKLRVREHFSKFRC